MGFEQQLVDRTMAIIKGVEGLTVKEMFGGVGFLIHGNMSCGVNGADLIVRVGPDLYDGARSEPHVKEFDMTGRAMRGWVVVEGEGIQEEDTLRRWVERGVQFARTLPPK